MNITKAIARNIVNSRYDAIPAEVVVQTKRQVLDTLGIMLPSSSLEKACIALADMAVEAGGKPESSLIGFGVKVPSHTAAFVNGSLCHPMDYDDSGEDVPSHPSANTFPAALAMAERCGGVSGKEFLTAMSLGVDLNIRCSTAPRGSLLQDYPWSPTNVFGVFSATAAAGKLAGLDEQEMINAFGIAVDRASGIMESLVAPESEIRAIRDAFGNREGILAALMAERGITSCRAAFEILFKVFYNDNYEPSCLTSKLGAEWWGLKVGFKAWPCCRLFQAHVTAALNILKEYRIDPDEIVEIVATVGSAVHEKTCLPLRDKQRPKLSINAKYSLPFVLGLVFTKGRVAIRDFSPQSLKDPAVLKTVDKVKPNFDPLQPRGVLAPGKVEVRMRGGRSVSRIESLPYGHSKNPMSDEQLIGKFRDCALYAKKALCADKINRLVEKILSLEKVENIKEITELLE